MVNLLKSVSRGTLRVYDARLQKRHGRYLAHFRQVVGYQPSIALPRRYHEKMLWRKLFDHSPLIALFCDKLATREFIVSRAPNVALPELLWNGDSTDGIPCEVLSHPAALKCNHGCDYNYFWDPGKGDVDDLKLQLDRWLGSVYGQTNHEWGYTVVRPRLMAEGMLAGPSPSGLVDINVRAACGRPLFCSAIAHNKTPRKALGYFDTEGNRIHFANSPIRPGPPDRDCYAELPPSAVPVEALREVAAIAALLSEGVDYARFDFLYDGTTLYAGEITAYPAAGLSAATPENETGPDTLVNKAWDLGRSWFLSAPQRGAASLYARALRRALD